MKSSAILLLLVLAVCCKHVSAQEVRQQKIDFSGVDAFWIIADKITADKVTAADWDALFATGYYAFYADWGQRESMQRALTIALSPKKNRERDSLLAIHDFNTYVLEQIIATLNDRVQFQQFRQQLAATDLRKKIIQRAKAYLPRDLNAYAHEPTIYFGVFQPDANASDQSIAVDLKLYAELADPIGLIAHEYHHFLTINYRKQFKEMDGDSTQLILKSVAQLQLEGIADLIDKERFLNSDGVGFPAVICNNFKKFHANPLPALHQMDSLLVAISQDPNSSRRNSEEILGLLPLGGHPHGYYMAKTILKAFGKKKLLKTVKNPFDFIRRYNEAELKLSGNTVFSREALTFLKLVEDTHAL